MARVLRRSAHAVLLVLILLAAVTLAAIVSYPLLGRMPHPGPSAAVPVGFVGYKWIEEPEQRPENANP